MKAKTIKAVKTKFFKELEAERKKIGDARDRLRDIQSEIESLLEATDQGVEALDTAIEHFSSLA